MRASAYLSIFDDWALLGVSLASIYDRVDEIVVVDGAYRWLAPVITAQGRDPTVSCPEVYAALAPFAAKVRVISGLWVNELEKRIAGFAACRHRHVFRIDADEVLFFDDAEIDRFLASPRGVAEMEMPITLAPGLIRGHPGGRIERQCLLFDRERIDADTHCAYLWLVLTPAERAALPEPRPELFHQEPIAFNAHLTHWRTPGSAINRARFYQLTHMREHRNASWLGVSMPDVEGDDAAWFAALFKRFAPERVTDLCWGGANTVGWTGIETFGICPTPLSKLHGSEFADLFDAQLAALTDLNRRMTLARFTMRMGMHYLIDVSSTAALRALGRSKRVVLCFDEAIAHAEAKLLWLTAEPPYSCAEPIAARVLQGVVELQVPAAPAPGSIRCVLCLLVYARSGAPFATFAIDG